jgi:hypothetical protein
MARALALAALMPSKIEPGAKSDRRHGYVAGGFSQPQRTRMQISRASFLPTTPRPKTFQKRELPAGDYLAVTSFTLRNVTGPSNPDSSNAESLVQ